jgi:hypothetical protein
VSASSAKCTVDTELNISGKVAQFGRGALADVSDKLLLQFVDNLNALIASQPAVSTSSATAEQTSVGDAAQTTTPNVRKIEQTQEVAPLDLLDTAGGTIAKRLIPVAIVVVAVVAVLVIFR